MDVHKDNVPPHLVNPELADVATNRVSPRINVALPLGLGMNILLLETEQLLYLSGGNLNYFLADFVEYVIVCRLLDHGPPS